MKPTQEQQEYMDRIRKLQEEMAFRMANPIWKIDPNAPPGQIFGFQGSIKKAPITDGPTDK